MSIKVPGFKAILSSLLLVTIFLHFTSVAVAEPGDLDPTFDTDGKVVTIFGTSDAQAKAVAVQTDGKIITAGYALVGGTTDAAKDFALARYNTDGSLDTTFDGDGRVTTDFNASVDEVRAIVLQPDGKIVVAGAAAAAGSSFNFALARYNTDGSLDPTFDTDGKVMTIFVTTTDEAFAVALQPDGKIVAAGRAFFNGVDDFAAARYNADGSLDTTFDTDGKLTTDFGANIDRAQAIVIQPDGKIVLAGYASIVSGFFDYALIRYNPDGSLDTSFDSDGKTSTAIGESNDEAFAIALQPDGKLVAAGRSFFNGLGYHFTLARYNADGSLDDGFDTDGRVVTNFNVGGFDTAYALALQTNGKIVAVGSAAVGTQFYDVAIARYNADGSLDTSFDVDGRLMASFGGTDDETFAVALQPDGKIVVAGYTLISNQFRFAVARYLGDPVLIRNEPFDFDGDDKADVSIFRPSNGQWWVNTSSNGGNFTATFGAGTDIIAPGDYTGDGKTDIAFWRPSTGEWFALRSEDFSYFAAPFGTNGDIPRPSDWDADGKTDFIVYRPSDNIWYRINSTGTTSFIQFGSSGDKPVTGDFDGDGKTDVAIFRPSTGTWWWQSSLTGVQSAAQWGISTDTPVPADYDADGTTDLAVYRASSGTWYIINSSNGSFTITNFGLSEDRPVPADYDGDGRADVAVFRPSTGIWYLLRSNAGFSALQFGLSTDIPTPNAFVP